MPPRLLHNWKFNSNTLDSVSQNDKGIDLIVQPEIPNLWDTPYRPLGQLQTNISSVTYQDRIGGKYLKWNGTQGACSAYATTLYPSSILNIIRNQSGVNQYKYIISCRIKWDGTNRPGFLFCGPATSTEISIDVNTTSNRFTLNNIEFGPTITVDQWYFLAIFYDGNYGSSLFVSIDNDQLTQINWPAGLGFTSDPFSTIYTFDGLYDLRIYDSASAQDIATIYNNGIDFEIADNLPTTRWKYPYRHHFLDNDLIDNIRPTPNKSQKGNLVTFVQGKVNQGIQVGRDNTVTQVKDIETRASLVAAVPYSNAIGLSGTDKNCTHAMWVAVNNLLTTPGTYNERYVSFDQTNIVFHKDYGFVDYGNISGALGISLPPISQYPTFTHITVTYNYTYGRGVYYFDGIPRAQFFDRDYTRLGVNTNFLLGYDGEIPAQPGVQPVTFYNGRCVIDDVRAYNVQLNQLEISSIYSYGVGTQSSTVVRGITQKSNTRTTDGNAKTYNIQRAIKGQISKNYYTSTFKICGWFKTSTLLIGGLYHALKVALIKEIETNHESLSVLQASYNKQHTIDLYNVYRQEYNATIDNLLIATGLKSNSGDNLLLKTTDLQHNTDSIFYTARDHISNSNLYLPHYLYADSEIKAFTNAVKAKFSAPKALPTDIFKPAITGSVKPPSYPKFPLNPTDGQLFIDNFGNRWTYNISSGSWISKGDAGQPNIASDDNNGIITPEIYDKFEYLRTIGSLPNYLKISPVSKAYYYYFRSSDKLIDFIPEGNDRLRIEISQSRLYSNLYRQLCPGIRGEQGDQGDRGDTGIATAEELTYIPKVENNLIQFLAFTYAPLKLNGVIALPNDHVPYISVRLYALTETGYIDDPLYYQKNYLPRYYLDDKKNTPYINRFLTYIQNVELGLIDDNTPLPTVLNPSTEAVSDNILAEIYIDPTGTFDNELIYADDRIGLNKQATLDSFIYDEVNCFVRGTFIFSEAKKPYTFAVRTMQMGPDGNKGATGINCIQLTNNILTNQNIVATAPIINVRYDAKTKTFFTFSASLTDNSALRNSLCAKYLRLLSGNDSLNDRPAFDTAFISAETTLKDCKLITSYKPSIRSFDMPDLDLKNWHPTGEISQSKNWTSQNFPWYSSAGDIPASCTKNAKTALDILGALSNSPPDQGCCQEPFVYFPAVQDGPCANETTGINPISSPSTSPPTSPQPTPTPPTPTPPTPTPPTPTPPTPTPPTPTPPTPNQAGCDKYGQCNLRPVNVKVNVGNQEGQLNNRTTYVIQPGGKVYSTYNKNCVASLYPKGLTKNAKSFIDTLKSFIPYGQHQFETGPLVSIMSSSKTRTIVNDKVAISTTLNPVFPQALEITYGDMSKPSPDGCPGPSQNAATSRMNLIITDAYSYIDAICYEIMGCQGYEVRPTVGVYLSFYIEWVIDGVSVYGAEWDLNESSFGNPDKISLKTPGTKYVQEVKFEYIRNTIDLTGITTESDPNYGVTKALRGCPTSEYLTIPERNNTIPPVTRSSMWRFINR